LAYILVTGGAGFVGANFVLEWLAEPEAQVDRPGHDRRYAIDASKLRRVLDSDGVIRKWIPQDGAVISGARSVVEGRRIP
jgi:dTDP-D-glucose 4,6-dehydratase